METAGVVLSAVALSSLFQTCLQLYDNILTAKNTSKDLEFYSIDFKMQKLETEAIQNVLLEKQSLGRMTCYPIVEEILRKIQEILEQIEAIFFQQVDDSRNTADEEGKLPKRGLRAATAHLSFASKKPSKTIAWLGNSRERLVQLLAMLNTLNGHLKTIMSRDERQTVDFRLRAKAVATENPLRLQEIVEKRFKSIKDTSSLKQQAETVNDSSTTNNPIAALEHYKCGASSISWMKFSLGAAARTHQEDVTLGHVVKLERAFGYYRSKNDSAGVYVLVEFRDIFTSTASEKSSERLDQLVSVLRSMHRASDNKETSDNDETSLRSVDFSILECQGWLQASDHRIGLIFNCVQVTDRRPLSLSDRIRRDRSVGQRAPPLGTRFDLAYGLAKIIADFVTIGWVHREIRSSNLIFFDPKQPRKFYLTGFGFSRANHFTRDASALTTEQLAHMWYRPPSYFAQTTELQSDETENTRITSAVDIYALGVIMIELAYWKTAEELQRSRPNVDQDEPWTIWLKSMDSIMGDVYTGVAKRCLALGNWAEDDEQEREFIARMLHELGQVLA